MMGWCGCAQPVRRVADELTLQASLENVVEGQHMLTSLSDNETFQ